MGDKMYTSNAQWDLEVYSGSKGDGITTDNHSSQKEAQSVCDMLEKKGFGGDERAFPIRTWVDEN